MDNLTHTLFALTLARTPLGRAGRGTTATLVLASNVPDIDIAATVRGAPSYLTWHRGPTHGPLGLVGLGLLTAWVVWAAYGILESRSPSGEPRAGFRMLAPIAIIGVAFHLLMDLPTSYGIRALSPFDWHWFAIDWMPIVDVYLLFVLAAGLLFGRASAAAGRRNAALVIGLMAANYGVRAVAHHQALTDAPRLFGPLLPQRCEGSANEAWLVDSWPVTVVPRPPQAGNRCLVEVVAVPTFFSPFRWRVIAHLSNAYEIHDIDLLEARFPRPASEPGLLRRTTRRFPNVWTPAVWAAASTDLGRTFLGFARLPAARSFVDPTGIATVRWTDIRFVGTLLALGQPLQRADPFTAVIRIAPDGHVLDEHLGP
jgi:membrane-bound metal-dependent hydrolase YbcI (DUF457 family)